MLSMSDPKKRMSITYVNDTGRDDFSVYVSGMPYVASDLSNFVAWQTLRSQSTAAFLFPMAVGMGLVWEGVTYGPHLTPSSATWEVTVTSDMEPICQQVAHQPGSGNLVVVKNMTQLSQLTIGIFKAKKLFLAKKEVQSNKVYRFNVSSVLYFNAGTRGDIQGQNFRINMAEFEEGLVVVVKYVQGEFVFSASHPDMARSIFRREDQQALVAMRQSE